jgi:hypothetical protein
MKTAIPTQKNWAMVEALVGEVALRDPCVVDVSMSDVSSDLKAIFVINVRST